MTATHCQEDDTAGVTISVKVSSSCTPGATCGGLCTPALLTLGSCMPGVYRLQYTATDSGGLSDVMSVDVHVDELQGHTLSFTIGCQDLTVCMPTPTYESSVAWALSLMMTPREQWALARYRGHMHDTLARYGGHMHDTLARYEIWGAQA